MPSGNTPLGTLRGRHAYHALELRHRVAAAATAATRRREISNVVDNAARHAASVVQITVSHVGDTVRLVVDDDGPGIPASQRERVFERFARLDDGRARHDGGTGLGLAVVRSILIRHHATVWVDDSPIGGARVIAEFPSGTSLDRAVGAGASERSCGSEPGSKGGVRPG